MHSRDDSPSPERPAARRRAWCGLLLVTSLIMFMAMTGPAGAAAARAVAPNPTSTPSAGPAETSEPEGKVVFRLADPRIPAPGDMVASSQHRHVLWTYDSRPGRPQLFAVDTRGRTVATFSLAGITASGWNSIALARTGTRRFSLFLGDLKNSAGTRSSVVVHQVTEPEQLTGGTLKVKSYRIRYPDGPQDADVLMAAPSDGRRYVVTKSAAGSKIYALPSELVSSRVNRLTLMQSLDFAVRDGGFAADGRVVLRDAGSGSGAGVARVLSGVGGSLTQVIKLPRATRGGPFAVSARGQLLLGGTGPRPQFLALTIPSPPATPMAGSRDLPVEGEPVGPIEYPQPAALPGGLLGTGSLVAIVALIVFGLMVHRRSRHSGDLGDLGDRGPGDRGPEA